MLGVIVTIRSSSRRGEREGLSRSRNFRAASARQGTANCTTTLLGVSILGIVHLSLLFQNHTQTAMNSYNYNFEVSGYEDSTDQYQNQQYGYHEYGTTGGNPSYGDYGYDETDNDPNEESEFAMGEDIGGSVSEVIDDIDFDDPRIANLPRILLMGPRRAGKTSIQVCKLFETLQHLRIYYPGIYKYSNILFPNDSSMTACRLS